MAKRKPRELTRAHRILHSIDLNAGARPARGEVRPGSIRQNLDMYEEGPLRGDEILHRHGLSEPGEFRESRRPLDEEFMEHNFSIDMSEDGREGDEESGDEHSSGLQGSDQQELQYDIADPEDSNSGTPGEMTEKIAHLSDPTRKGYRRRAS